MDDFSSKIYLNEKMSIKVLNTVPGNKLSGLLYLGSLILEMSCNLKMSGVPILTTKIILMELNFLIILSRTAIQMLT